MNQLKDLITEAPVHERKLEIKTNPLTHVIGIDICHLA